MAWDSQTRKQAITLECATVLSGTGSRSNVPFPITEAAFATSALDGGADSIKSDGGDLRLYSDADGLNRLPIDIIKITTGVTPKLVMRLLVDIADVEADQTVYAAWGDGVSSQPAVGAAFGQYATYPDLNSYLQATAGEMTERTGNHAWTISNTLSVDPTTEDCPFSEAAYHAGGDYTYSDAAGVTGLIASNDTSILIYTKTAGYGGGYTGINFADDSNSDELTLNQMDNALTAGGPRLRDASQGYNNMYVAHGTSKVNEWLHTGYHKRAIDDLALSSDGVEVDTYSSASNSYAHTRVNVGSRRSGHPGYHKWCYVMFWDSAITQAYELTIVELDSDPDSAVTAGTPEDIVTNSAPTGSVTISGPVASGNILTANNTLADADGLGTFTYAWLRDDVVISGATSDTYVLTAFDVNTTIKSRISYTDGEGNAESEESAGVGPITGKVETTYQDCYFTIVTDHVQVAGSTTFLDIPLPVRTVHVPAGFFDGGSGSAVNGGGNIEVHKDYPFTGSTRIPAKIIDFDINAGTIDFEYLHPSLSAIAAETIYIRKVNADQAQPAADEAYGSDLVDNAVTFPDDANLVTTLANAANNDNFYTTGPLVCTLVGGVTPSEPSEYRFLQSVLSDPISSVMRTYDG